METPEKEAMSRKERERERHRGEILGAAERVFVRDGYHGTTMESIAKEAEFAVGTLYNFFTGKEELYAEVLYRIAGEMMEDFEREVVSKEDPREAIGAVFDLRVKYLEKHGDFFRLMLQTGPSRGENVHANVMRMFDRYIQMLTGVLDRGMKQGVFAIENPVFVALCLEGVCNAMMLYWTQYRSSVSLAELAQKAKAAFLNQIRVRPPEGHQGENP